MRKKMKCFWLGDQDFEDHDDGNAGEESKCQFYKIFFLHPSHFLQKKLEHSSLPSFASWRHDIQYKDTQHNNMQHNATDHEGLFCAT